MFKSKAQELTTNNLNDLAPYESRVYSQNGEDGIIEEIFKRIGLDSKFAVEFGVEDGSECNTKLLRKRGWRVLQMDGDPGKGKKIEREYITADNINDLFKKYKVPKNLDFLSIDIDSNDWYVWKAIDSVYKPRLVCVEYNASFAPQISASVAYDPKLVWDKTTYFGASLMALYRLARSKGYDLVYCTTNGVNAFFVRVDLMPGHFEPKTPLDVYRGPDYGGMDEYGIHIGHKPTNRSFVTVNTDLSITS